MTTVGRDDLRDALSQLPEWITDAREISRTMRLNDSEHAALTERIKVVSDALQKRPDIRRKDGLTHIRVRPYNGRTLTDGEIHLAARIEDAYRTVTETGR